MTDIEVQKRDIEKERQKLRTEKLEYNRWLREEARDELICERICDAIKELPPLDIPSILPANVAGRVSFNREGCLLIADPHYGVDLKIKGLFGEIINEYSPEIFESRMWDLLTQVIDICEKEGFIPRYATDIPQDKVDITLQDMQGYLYKLVTQDLGFGQQIEDSLKKIMIQKEMNDAADQDIDLELQDEDFEAYIEEAERQKDLDAETMAGDWEEE